MGSGTDEGLVEALLGLLGDGRVDWTSFFRALAGAARGDASTVRAMFVEIAAFDAWLARWSALAPDADLMDRTNPVYIPRNHLVEEALTQATVGEMGPYRELLDAVTQPFVERAGFGTYARPAPVGTDTYVTYCGT